MQAVYGNARPVMQHVIGRARGHYTIVPLPLRNERRALSPCPHAPLPYNSRVMRGSGRPRSVTITALWVFLLGTWNVWRAVEVSGRLRLLLELGSTLDPRIRVGMAAIWAVLFIALAVLLWQGRAAVRRLLPISLALYAVYRLSLLAFFVPAAAARRGWPVTVVLYAVALAWTVWALYRPANDHFWKTAKDGANDGKRDDEE